MEGMKGKKWNCRSGVQRGGGANGVAAAALIRKRRPGRSGGFSSSVPHETPALCPDAAGGTPAGGAGLGLPASRADVPHVEVDHILGVGPLDRDGEGLEGVEGEGHQASDCVVHGTAQKARLDLKLQKTGVPCVKPVREMKERQRCPGSSLMWDHKTPVPILEPLRAPGKIHIQSLHLLYSQ